MLSSFFTRKGWRVDSLLPVWRGEEGMTKPPASGGKECPGHGAITAPGVGTPTPSSRTVGLWHGVIELTSL